MIARRALASGAVLTLAAASLVVWLGKPWSALALTLTAAVGMINGLWLEGLLVGILQPGKARVGRGAVALLIGRWALWALLFGVPVPDSGPYRAVGRDSGGRVLPRRPRGRWDDGCETWRPGGLGGSAPRDLVPLPPD